MNIAATACSCSELYERSCRLDYRRSFILFKKSLKLGSEIWYYVVYDETGKRRQFSCETKFKYQALQYDLDLYKNDAFKINTSDAALQRSFKRYRLQCSTFRTAGSHKELAVGFNPLCYDAKGEITLRTNKKHIRCTPHSRQNSEQAP